VTTLAGSAGDYGANDGRGIEVRFDWPEGVAVDSAGSVFAADTGNSTIRKVTPDGVVTTLAGSAGDYGTNDGPGVAARFDEPEGVAVDGEGNVYVADTWNSTIRKVSPGGVVTTLAGSAGDYGTNDGPGVDARFDLPAGVAVDSVGNVYVADTWNCTIRKISLAGVVTTLAGSAGECVPTTNRAFRPDLIGLRG
jgi:sugar lactone lactonase YvrE